VNRARSARPSLRLLAVSLAAFVTLGLIEGALGVAWPSIREAFGRDVSDLGLLLAFGSLGYLTASTGYGWLHNHLGTGNLLAIGGGLLVSAVVGIAGSSQWLIVATAAILLGLGGGLVDTGMNAHAALVFDVGSINVLHACYGVGATLGPVVITVSLVSTGVWRGGYAVIAGSQVLVALAILARRGTWTGAEPDLSADHPLVTRRGQMWLMMLLFFLYTGAEVATGQWAFTLLTEGRGMSTAGAGTWVAVYWGGLTLGRFGFGMIGERLSPSRTLGGSMVVALLGVAMVWLDPFGFGAVGLPLAGLGFAAVFPTMVALTPARIGRLRSTRSIGYQLAAANIGAAGVPWALGLVAGAFGVEALAPGLFIAAALLALLHFVTDRGDDRGEPASAV
jgi:fucose permease